MLRRFTFLASFVLLLVACDGGDGIREAPPFEEWERYRAGIPEDQGFQPDITDWESLESRTRPRGGDPESAARQWLGLHDMLYQAEAPEGRLLPLGVQGNFSVVLFRRWGFKDDSVAGEEVRLRLRRSEDTGNWFVVEAEQRWYCRRGVVRANVCI
jgi:hypothetical protein